MYRVLLTTIMKIIAATEKTDFLILSETHLTKDIDEQEITLQGYDNIGPVLTSSRTGEVVVYYKKNWNVKNFLKRTGNLKYWILFCKAVHIDNNHKMLIGAIYISPSYSEA